VKTVPGGSHKPYSRGLKFNHHRKLRRSKFLPGYLSPHGWQRVDGWQRAQRWFYLIGYETDEGLVEI
jgi:hypothetical protein